MCRNSCNNIVLSSRDVSSGAFVSLQCRPNPAKNEIWIDWPEGKDAPARLYRWDGAYIGTFQLQALGKNRLEIGDLPAGVYGVQVVVGNRVYGGRFVKM